MSNSNILAGRYELIEKIGDGGMAIVYKAKDILLKRNIAVKILKQEYTGDLKFVENFKKESHAAASLSHPNIVSIYDVGQEGNINYIVMELIEGVPLNEIIEKKAPLDYREAINLIKQVALGISAAHKNGIVHRDIKPHNILVTYDGVAKIADFGIAKAVTNTTIVDGGKEKIMGSVHYFSPEQARGGYVDKKSDIYSLGIVLFEMLTGRVPFDGDNPVTVALKQINEQIIAPSVFNPTIPPTLEKIILKATEKYPADRFDNIDDMIVELENVETLGRVGISDYNIHNHTNLYGNEVGNYENGSEKKHIKFDKKKKIIIGAVVTVILLLVVAYVLGFFNKKDIEVPDFSGMTLEEAENKARELNLKVEVGEYEYSAEYEQDKIISQDPKAGEKVAKNQVIKVDISKGGKKGAVPNLIGKDLETAKKMVKEYGFKVGEVTEQSSTETKDTVISQDPSAGEEAKEGDTINIVVSDGKGQKSVPNLLGLSESEAKKAIEDAGFKVGTVGEGVSQMYDKGQVMWQEFAANTKLDQGSTISFRISTGKSSTINIALPLDQAKNDAVYVTVKVTDSSGTRTVISNKKYNKNDDDIISVTGVGQGTVTILFDEETVMTKNLDFSRGDAG